MQDLRSADAPDGARIEWITERVLHALAHDEAVDPLALTFLLRRYRSTDRADLADALGPALARALQAVVEDAPQMSADTSHLSARRLMLFAEASAISDDDRLRTSAADLVASLCRAWPRLSQVEPLALSIDACLMATEIVDPHELVPKAIDELERVIGATYRPGAGLAHSVAEPDGERGRLGDHVRAASALLTAYSFSARLPYAMLAEELIQFARRTLWDEEGGGFRETAGAAPGSQAKPFVLNCEAARVLCRLATLHRSKEYCDAAVVAPEADYGRDAARTLAALEPSYGADGVEGAIYGIALAEWQAL